MIWMYMVAFAAISGAMFYFLVFPRMVSEEGQSEASSVKWILLGAAVLVPLISLLIYDERGASDEVMLIQSMQSLNSPSETQSMESIIDYQRDLEAITREQPDRAEYWFMLGSLHVEMQNFEEGVAAYESAAKAAPGDLSIQSRLAEAQFLADDYMLTEAVRGYIDSVLESDPEDATVLGILGISAYRAGQYEAAIRFWERSIQGLPPMSPSVQSVLASIEQARIAGGIDRAALSEIPEAQEADPEAVFIDVSVRLAESIQASPATAVFVFARQFGGPPMPVVVERITASQLPIRLRLDDSKVMIQGRKLADFAQLELVARLSYSGSPTAVPGDYQKVIGPINPVEIQGVVELEISDLVTE